MTSAPLPSATITVAHRFRGPERSGNGGYTAGRLAAFVATRATEAEVPVTVTLRQPPPLGVALAVRPVDTGVELWDREVLVASARPGGFEAEPVEPVDFETATAARSSYGGLRNHPFPGCFACGPGREPGDGLRLAPGLVEPGRTACVWVPDPSLASADEPSVTAPEFAWAALDCPGGWTSDLDARPLVLGRMTARCLLRPRVGVPHVVVGRLLAEDGRKTFTATSLYDGGRLVGRAEHTWIAVDPTLFNA